MSRKETLDTQNTVWQSEGKTHFSYGHTVQRSHWPGYFITHPLLNFWLLVLPQSPSEMLFHGLLWCISSLPSSSFLCPFRNSDHLVSDSLSTRIPCSHHVPLPLYVSCTPDPRLALNSWLSHFSLPRAGITKMCVCYCPWLSFLIATQHSACFLANKYWITHPLFLNSLIVCLSEVQHNKYLLYAYSMPRNQNVPKRENTLNPAMIPSI